jgi:hypothetical protein
VFLFKSKVVSIALALIGLGGQWAWAQGCVAAHSNQRSFDELMSSARQDASQSGGHNWMHNLTVDIGYRVFSSNKYFQGSREIARPTAVENHQNLFDIGVQYDVTQRWSVIADVPVFNGTRDQIYPPKGIFQVSGLGDITVGVRSLLFRPPTENGGNIAVNLQLKMPTGIDNAMGRAVLNGQTVEATADLSWQPGDGRWCFCVGTEAY